MCKLLAALYDPRGRKSRRDGNGRIKINCKINNKINNKINSNGKINSHDKINSL